MSILDFFRRPKAEVERSTALSLAFEDWVGLATSFSFNGIGYTLPGSTQEDLGSSFQGLARGGMKGNGVVFACIANRVDLFSEARFMFRRLRSGRPGDLFGTRELEPLNAPWPGGTTGDLLARMLQYVDIAGNAYVVRRGGRLTPLRPDWVTIIGGVPGDVDASVWHPDAQILGYAYTEGGPGSGNEPMLFTADEVAHFAPRPDPEARFRGMSWLSPIVREVMADKAMNDHKLAFLENGATPNIAVKLNVDDLEKFKGFVKEFERNHAGAANAYKTMFLAAGADVVPVGTDLRQLDFKITQGAGETRIAAAAGVPPVIVGLSEGLAAATYCLPAEELVWTPEGPREIGGIRAGDEVWSSEGDARPSRVLWQGKVGEKQVFEVRTKNRVFRATDNHPVLVRVAGHSKGGNSSRAPRLDWRAVGELRPGDQIVQAKSLPDRYSVQPEWASHDLVRWLGAYLGDGSGAGKGSLRLAIPPTDRVRLEYERLTSELFEARIGYEPRGFRMHGRGTSEMVAMLGFEGTAQTKRIPGWVFRLPRHLRLAFLAGLMDTDGSVDKRGVGALGFANRDLVEQARALFVSCGIQVSNVAYRNQLAVNLPNPGLRESYDFWSFAISTGLGDVPTFDPLYRDRLAGRRDSPEGGDVAKAGLDPDEFGFYTIRSITAGDVVPVYDIEVEGSHSFFAAGVAVHNSNYAQARRRFADQTMRPLWRNACASLARIVDVPSDAELWYDDRDIKALQEDQQDAAQIMQTDASSAQTLVNSGFTPESVVAAIAARDLTLLVHTGLLSVQLQDPTATPDAAAAELPSAAPAKRDDPLDMLEAELMQMLRDRDRDDRQINVNVQTPDVKVDVAPAAVTVEPAQVTLEPARWEDGAIQVHVDAAPTPDVNVTVESPSITVEPARLDEGAVVVNVEAAPAPDVNVTVESPSVTVDRAGKRKVTFDDGRSATVTDGDVKLVEYDDGRTVRIEEVD